MISMIVDMIVCALCKQCGFVSWNTIGGLVATHTVGKLFERELPRVLGLYR